MHDATLIETVDLYLNHGRGVVSDATIASYHSRLDFWKRFCRCIETIEGDIAEKVDSIDIGRGESAKDDILNVEVADAMINYLSTYQHSLFLHAMLLM